MTETVDAEGNHGGIVCEHAFACHIGIRSPRLRLGAGYACAADIPANVDAARMKQADRDAANWLSYGRTYSEQRFRPLKKITSDRGS